MCRQKSAVAIQKPMTNPLARGMFRSWCQTERCPVSAVTRTTGVACASQSVSGEDGSWDPREQIDELSAHHLPAVARATEVLLLARLEARMHEGHAGPRRRGREREGHDGIHLTDDPRVAD